ncbi:MAG: PaaX family transcriptional regulator C-terminal domain-containing protein [Actinomycetota bacterium]|nr:PaaX family transcriptional regulator C-terminal domain-containing protein [Actinomycetota bacterium]
MEPEPPHPQELLITLLANELLHRPQSRVWAGGLVHLLAEFGFSTSASRAALGRLAKRELLERHMEGREAYYSLTDRAVGRLSEGERRILEFTASDTTGTWTLLNYALPAGQRTSRDRLRRRLAFLGYGPTHDGSWIAPGDRVADTDQVLRNLDLATDVDIFVGRPAMSTDVGRLISRAWPDLTEVAKSYEAFTQRWTAAPETRSPLADRTLLMHQWRRFPLIDPGLADTHLPWAPTRAAAREVFQRQWHQLAIPASVQFGEACRLIPAQNAT